MKQRTDTSVTGLIASILVVSMMFLAWAIVSAEPTLEPKKGDKKDKGFFSVEETNVTNGSESLLLPAPFDITVLEIYCFIQGPGETATLDMDRCDDEADNCSDMVATMSCADETPVLATPAANKDIAKGQYLKILYSDITGVLTKVTLLVVWEEDDP